MTSTNCLSRMIGCLSNVLEELGLYEPELSIEQAKERLRQECEIWKDFQTDRCSFWRDFQANRALDEPLPSFVDKAIVQINSQKLEQRVVVNLGCGIDSTTFQLLDQGWKVYAVDNSDPVLQTLAQKVSALGKKWIEDGQLVLIQNSIEQFKYPEKVHLIIAVDSIPYCDPEKINEIFLEAKSALLPQGVFVCNLFPYRPDCDPIQRSWFGAWMTTKNVADAVVRSTNFSSSSVTEGRSPSGLARQFHILASN